jgi:hypothetical protein
LASSQQQLLAAEDAIVDEYLSIQRQVDCLPFQTSDSDFSYCNSLTFYNYFIDRLNEFTGDADKLNFFNKFKEIFMDLPKTVHAVWKKLAREDLKQRRRKKGRTINLAMQLRIPNFILVAKLESQEDLGKICTHLCHYFWVFCRPIESGVVFNFDSRLPLLAHLCHYFWVFCRPIESGVVFNFDSRLPLLAHLCHYFFWVFCRPIESGVVLNFDSRLPLLGLHLQELHDHFDSSVLTLVAEEVEACYQTDTRSVFSSDLHGFGVGSYVSHGCGRHTSVKLPCLVDNNRYFPNPLTPLIFPNLAINKPGIAS